MNTLAPLDAKSAEERVLGWQTKLHRWAAQDEQARFGDLFNLVWELLERPGRSAEEDDRMVHAAHASRYHWGQVGQPTQFAIGEWQCARVYSVLGRAEPALHHARRCASGLARRLQPRGPGPGARGRRRQGGGAPAA